MYGGLAGADGTLCPQGLSCQHRAAVRQPHQPAGRTAVFCRLCGLGVRNLLAGGFRTQIAAHLSEDGVVNLSGIAQQYAGFLPESFRASIVAACERSINAVLADNAVVLADTIVEKVLQPLLTPVIMLVLFFVFYAVLRLLVSMLVTVLGLVNKLPVIGTVNRGLGWLTGGMTALLDLYLVLCVVWGLVVITGGNLNVLNDTVMHSSLYYKAFNMFNPFL